MGKRKLRNCANCGGRHGPPTGKSCVHEKQQERKEDDEICHGIGAGPDTIFMDGEGEKSAMNHPSEEKQCDYDELLDYVIDKALPQRQTPPDTAGLTERPFSPAGSGAKGALFLRQRMSELEQSRLDFEDRMDGKMKHMENLLGKVAGVQQAQLKRLVHLANHPVGPPPKVDENVKPEVEKPKPAQAARSPAAESLIDLKDLSDMAVPDVDRDWKEYHGFAAWHLENEKKKKKTFDYQAYIRKGEKVTTFEEIMVVTFKTLSKIADLKGDVRGLIEHGLVMADKASKSLFVSEAFVGYDEGVRERAGESGPKAFGVVQQEEILKHFCYENTKKHRAQSKTQVKTSRSKSDKTCHRFNDGGCQSKSCMYSHRCSNCDDYNHSKKNCTNGDKRKDGK